MKQLFKAFFLLVFMLLLAAGASKSYVLNRIETVLPQHIAASVGADSVKFSGFRPSVDWKTLNATFRFSNPEFSFKEEDGKELLLTMDEITVASMVMEIISGDMVQKIFLPDEVAFSYGNKKGKILLRGGRLARLMDEQSKIHMLSFDSLQIDENQKPLLKANQGFVRKKSVAGRVVEREIALNRYRLPAWHGENGKSYPHFSFAWGSYNLPSFSMPDVVESLLKKDQKNLQEIVDALLKSMKEGEASLAIHRLVFEPDNVKAISIEGEVGAQKGGVVRFVQPVSVKTTDMWDVIQFLKETRIYPTLGNTQRFVLESLMDSRENVHWLTFSSSNNSLSLNGVGSARLPYWKDILRFSAVVE